MFYSDDKLWYSPSDLNRFFESQFTSWMDRFKLEHARKNSSKPAMLSLACFGLKGALELVPDPDDEESKLIQKHGERHEAAWLGKLKESGKKVTAIPRESNRDAAAKATLAAMKAGSPIIYQAFLRHGNFAGYADFLTRVDGSSKLGGWHYQVSDTKLARTPKPYFLLQLCCYADLLQEVQGVLPAQLQVVLGSGEIWAARTVDYFHYYQAFRHAFERFHDDFDSSKPPHPATSVSFGQWSGVAEKILTRLDHLSAVARMTRTQIRKLNDAKIETCAELAKSKAKSVPGMDAVVFARLRRQCQLQRAAEPGKPPQFEVAPPTEDEPRRGLAFLPPPDKADVFFDMEGYPHAEGGLEYLFGAITLDGKKSDFHDWWAHGTKQERKAFEQFVDWVFARWKKNPDMHIFHYAAYETSALKRLAQKYATREHEIDEFLRHGVFVDAYTVVRQGLLVGTPSYSLKDIELLYRPPRATDVKTAAGSVVAYEKWLDSGQPGYWNKSSILAEIRDYNRDDCVSLAELCKWLWDQQNKAKIKYVAPESTSSKNEQKDADAATPVPPSKALANKILASLNDDPKDDSEQDRRKRLMAHLLEFHWRELKPAFWRMFNWGAMTEEELLEEFDCLAGLRRTKAPPNAVNNLLYCEYRFDVEQETKLGEGSRCLYSHDLKRRTEIFQMDLQKGLVQIYTPKKHVAPDRLNLIPHEVVDNRIIAEGVFRYVEGVLDGKSLSRAIDDLLARRRPRIKGRTTGSVLDGKGDLTQQTCRTIQAMDRTTLCIQGPPGTGKTYTSAHAIVALMTEGKCVGVMANSHKAILNLLRKVDETARELGVDCDIFKLGGDADDGLIAGTGIVHAGEAREIETLAGRKSTVIGATAWAFSRPPIEGKFDYLFVDEAGQVSLGNLIGSGLAARNLVLIGDQMQLSQPLQGAHPGESGQSAFDYLLQGHATIPDDMGVFLATTYRMHPEICGFISDAVYDGRLTAEPRTSKHRIDHSGSKLLKKAAGIQFCPVEHELNSQASDEEADFIEELLGDLLGRKAVAKSGKSLTIGPEHVLVVAPYNLQVRNLQGRLGDQLRVGSIDKFQGQEAPVVIISMCASTLEECPRGAEFLLNPNRLNVAVSRAQCLAVVVGSPHLTTARCGTVDQMRLLNLYSWLVN